MSSLVDVRTVWSHPRGAIAREGVDVTALLEVRVPAQHDTPSHAQAWRVKFVVDLSFSMRADLARLVESLAQAVDRVPDGSILAIDTFADDLLVLVPPTRVDATARQAAKRAIRGCRCRGGTNLELAFRALQAFASEPCDAGLHPFGVCFTDGQPMAGERDPVRLAALLSPSATFHMVAYKAASDCWVAKAFGERSVNNVVAYCVDAPSMLASIDRVLPDATKLTITGIALAVAPDAGVTVVGAPTAIPDLVEGAAVNVLVDLRLEAAALGAQTVGTATLSLYQGEVSEVVPLRLERVERAVAVPVPSELRAERLRVRAGAALGVVQREVAAQRLDVALEHVREVARDASRTASTRRACSRASIGSSPTPRS